MVVEVYIEGQKLDLFEDETIRITQSIQDVKDISKIFAAFSQSFNVPASKTNNIIFKHYYNQDINNGFDARTRKDAIININTIPFKNGKIQLNGVKQKNGFATQYNITFYDDAIKVKDLIGDDKLNTLDWLSNFDHDYSGTNVLLGLTDGLDFTVDGVDYDKAVVYPLISYYRQYFYNSQSSDHTNTDVLVNLAYHSGHSGNGHGVDFTELKPAIKLYLLVEAIQQKYGINFVGGFFESQAFKDIYVNLNKSTEKPANGFLQYENETVSVPPRPFLLNDQLIYSTVVTPKAGFENTKYKIRLSINGEVIFENAIFNSGTKNKWGFLQNPPDEVEITAEIISLSIFEFDATTELRYQTISIEGVASETTLNTGNHPDQVINLQTVITNELKDIKTYDFLISLFKTFNLTVSPLDGDLLVEDLQTWYTQGDIIDITPFVDTESKEVDKGVIFNRLEFKFEESEQILADEFNQSNNRIFGNEELTLYTDETQTKKLDGKTLKIESIFENPIFERLFDLNTNSETTIQYCPYFNREIKSISGEPFMFYGLSTDISANPIGFVGDGTFSEINTSVIMPSHSQQIDFASFTLNFYAEFNEYNGQVGVDNLFTRYYKDYVSDVFSIKRRNFKYKAILPLRILNGLKLNDRVIIGNTRYIINKMTSNLTKREDSLELINDIYDAPLASDILNTSLFVPSYLRYGPSANTDSVQYVGVENISPKKVDTGFDTIWLTINSYGTGKTSTINFTIDANTTGLVRTVGIQVLDRINNPKFLIIQEAGAITADTTLITSDTTLITADNG